ncbi:thioesterase II family protein [Veronia pacifica]|uniref:Thioesterase domain-containing protein n=1 Tax=Veronia pacifica TaxID=1080227 RepID=A0A1C3EMD6_9GAMM|nr:alpha/beta fold hydrolase [Veronia pacifica]ODA34385.1 hypothetical protein A8L45_06580 [Veronia pacifica]
MLNTINQTPWFQLSKANDPSIRLFCFPFAGGGASAYRHWEKAMPDHVQTCRVQLPGRENRIKAFPIREMNTLLNALAIEIQPLLDRPFAFFGHSMGAIVAYELARKLTDKGYQPDILFVSGCRPPHIVDTQPIHHLSTPEFVDALKSRGGIHEELLNSAEYMAMVEPTLRADLELIESWHRDFDTPLSCPLHVFAALDDKVSPIEVTHEWAKYSTLPLISHSLKGGHFFVQDPTQNVTGRVASALKPYERNKNKKHII